MFKLKLSGTYSWPVSVERPADTGGEIEKVEFEAEFRRITQDRFEEIWKKVDAGEITDRAVCLEVLAGWKNVQGDDGEQIPYTPENVLLVLNAHGVQGAVVRAFIESFTGIRRKNS